MDIACRGGNSSVLSTLLKVERSIMEVPKTAKLPICCVYDVDSQEKLEQHEDMAGKTIDALVDFM